MSKLIILCGVPGCGKSTYGAEYAKTHDNYVILSSDAIRAELFGDERIQSNKSLVFATMRDRVIRNLKANINVIYDATNLTCKNRRSIISNIPKGVDIECHVICTPLETCIQNDARRDRTVGAQVINMMYQRFQMPTCDEGFKVIKMVM